MAKGYRYEPTTSDFSNATTRSRRKIENLIGGGTDPAAIGVYLAAFDEVVDIFHSAQGKRHALKYRMVRQRWRRSFRCIYRLTRLRQLLR